MTVPVTADRAQVKELVHAHLPLVSRLVRELLSRTPAHVEREDLTSAGLTALVTTAASFDPRRCTPFEQFAKPRIRGALLDELRALDWASRSVRIRARQAEAGEQEMAVLLGRPPTTAELAGRLGCRPADITAVRADVHRAAVLSLEGLTAGMVHAVPADRAQGPEEVLLHRERLTYLVDAVAMLPDRLRTVVRGCFVEERSVADLAIQLGVSPSRISQLQAEAFALIRDAVNAQLDPDLVVPVERPGGCAARRRDLYRASVAARFRGGSRAKPVPTGAPAPYPSRTP